MFPSHKTLLFLVFASVFFHQAIAQGTLSTPPSRAWIAGDLASKLVAPTGNAPLTPEALQAAEAELQNSAYLRQAFAVSGIEIFHAWDQVSAVATRNSSTIPLISAPAIEDQQRLGNQAASPYRAAIADSRLASANRNQIQGRHFGGLDRKENPHRWPATELTENTLNLTWSSLTPLSNTFRYRVFLTKQIWQDGKELAWDDLEFLGEYIPEEVQQTSDLEETFSIDLPRRTGRASLVVIRENLTADARFFIAVADLEFPLAETSRSTSSTRQGQDQRSNSDNRRSPQQNTTENNEESSSETTTTPQNPSSPTGNTPNNNPANPSTNTEQFRFVLQEDNNTDYRGTIFFTPNTTVALVDPILEFTLPQGTVEILGFGVLTPSRGGLYRIQALGTFQPNQEISIPIIVTEVTATDSRGPTQVNLAPTARS